MKLSCRLAMLAALAACARTGSMGAPTASRSACDQSALASLSLEGARVTGATRIAAGTSIATAPGLEGLPAFCLVSGEVVRSAESRIRFELWIPEGDAWNGKLLVTGNGGYSPMLSYRDMAMGLRRGYAVAGGDTGHQTENPNDLRFVVGHPERMLDWGTRSIHAIAEPAKAIAAALGGREVRRAYFYGCSTGGHQGVAELERYPGDFDGVIAGAPGNNRVRLNAGFLWQFRANHAPGRDDAPILTPASVAMVGRAVVAACDTIDGVADGVIDDPRRCAWRPETLRCADAAGPACLTGAQVAALETMYAGARNPRTGEQVYPGWPKGSEPGWPAYWGGAEPARTDFWRYWVFGDPQWSWWRFDFDRDLARADSAAGSAIDHRSGALEPFRRRGGKAILYHGWADPVVSAFDVIAYYERVRAAQGSQATTDSFLRLFLVPGMGHCAGGAGATVFGNQGAEPPVRDAEHDVLEALDRWVERGIPPERIVAARVERGVVTRTRPLCPYPRRAAWTRSGDSDDAANFVCR